ncbi:hypothetical protein V6Z11_A06G032100 [Gossypium hirsutum]
MTMNGMDSTIRASFFLLKLRPFTPMGLLRPMKFRLHFSILPNQPNANYSSLQSLVPASQLAMLRVQKCSPTLLS